MDFGTYIRWDYFTLQSKTKGEYKRRGNDTIERFDSFVEAYQTLISLYDAENYNREEHGYWWIVRHTVTEYIENEEYHRYERIEPCVTA